MTSDAALAAVSDTDLLQEAKEAVADAHLEFIRRWTSGEGLRGRILFGARPSAKLASGFIVPRRNSNGDDESNDIRIPTHGLDIATRRGFQGDVAVTARVAVYLRVLPEADELFADDGLLVPAADYSPAVKRAMRDRRRRLRGERITAGMNRAEKQRVIDEIAREIEREYGVDAPVAAPAPALGAGPEEGEEGVEPIRTGMAARRRIPSCHSRDYEVPIAFIRIDVPPIEVAVPVGDAAARATAEEKAVARLHAAIGAACRAWIASEEGARRSWRSGARPQSEDFWTPGAWEIYLERTRRLPPVPEDLIPDFSLDFRFDALPLRSAEGGQSLRIAVENHQERDEDREYGLFGVVVEVRLPADALLPASLERVRRSYHLEGFLEVPAIGVNAGVEMIPAGEGDVAMRTTWMPRYVLPRTAQGKVSGVETRFACLAASDFDVASLAALPDAMDGWVRDLREETPPGDPAQTDHFRRDLDAWATEAERVRLGIALLGRSRDVARSAPEHPMAAPWTAWRALQETFDGLYTPTARNPEPGWRLFQLAFVLTHVPTLASRIEGFDGPEWFRSDFDEEAVTLLYMSTGGGKTEAFFGTVVYALFLDRLRGKVRGVTAMMHYPLRLLTVQQAQRLARTLAWAERVRRRRRLPGAPFEIGFWVGGGNTPNTVERFVSSSNGVRRVVVEEVAVVPVSGTARADDEAALMRTDAPGEDRLYQASQLAWNKLPTCPFCGSSGTGLRLFAEQHHRLGIVCHDAGCDWNAWGGGPAVTPLPFLLADTDIYRRAPSVLLGTIDKLALIGHDIGRIGQIGGMFGLARRIAGPTDAGLLEMGDPIVGDPPSNPVAPAHDGGREVFVDPFPSLIIQDEMHLLDESLGTFGGLFESSLFEWFRAIGPLLDRRAARYRAAPDSVRLPHVIGATATASDVSRHVRAIYQRSVVQFPHPGPGLHESFYVALKPWAAGGAADAARAPLRGTPIGDEAAAPWARIYASLMTNGRRHTVTTLAVLAAHAAASTRWLVDLADPATRGRAAEEIAAHQSGARFSDRRAEAVRALAQDGHWGALLALVDLHRINLTYVTNKKGGDQILSAIDDEVRESHRLMGERYALHHPVDGMRFATELISGGVDVGTIQGVVRLAEQEIVNPREERPFNPAVHPPWRGLRAIVATSAVSHGVDVEVFNAMTFAGLPSDIAEYIQASSRVGRTHVGFSLLVPTPQTRRDRYVVEVHEPFHRLLERMIPPPAAERWAERAIERAIPSIIQTWLAGVRYQHEFAKAVDKAAVRDPDFTTRVSAILEQPSEFDACVGYIARSFGVELQRSMGGAFNPPFYTRVIRGKLRMFLEATKNARLSLREVWRDGMVDGLHAPMTSLRDVDGQGVVRPSSYDGRREVKVTTILKGLNAIRSGAPGRVPRGTELEADDAPRRRRGGARAEGTAPAPARTGASGRGAVRASGRGVRR